MWLSADQVHVSSNVGAYRGMVAAQRGNSPGGIPPVKCRHLADRSCTSGAIRRIDRALVAPPGGQVTPKSTEIRASYYLKWCLLADRSCISVAPLTDSSQTNTIQIRVLFS